jgi:hypothetical protein
MFDTLTAFYFICYLLPTTNSFSYNKFEFSIIHFMLLALILLKYYIELGIIKLKGKSIV